MTVNCFPLRESSFGAAPIGWQRANRAQEVALQHSAGNRSGRLVEILPDVRGPGQTPRIAISNKRRILFVDLSEVFSIVAQGNYVLLQGEDGSRRLRGPISALAEKLEPYGFVRIHRSVMVNRRWVEEIRPSRTGEHVLRLKGGKEFTVTRSYKKNLRDLAELWLGSDTFPGRAALPESGRVVEGL